MDIRNLTFPNESFDMVIDKGTMDAMLTSKGDVWVSGLWNSAEKKRFCVGRR